MGPALVVAAATITTEEAVPHDKSTSIDTVSKAFPQAHKSAVAATLFACLDIILQLAMSTHRLAAAEAAELLATAAVSLFALLQ